MRVLASAAIVCLLAAAQAASVQATQTLAGTVVDPAGGAIPGVAIELRMGDKVLQRTTSDAAGEWTFRNVAPGEYTVRHLLAGFVTTDYRLTIGAAEPPRVRVTLKVGALSETVEVVDATALTAKRVEHLTGRGVGAGVAGAPGGLVGGVGGLPAPASPQAAPVRAGGNLGSEVRVMVSGLPHDTSAYAAIEENRFRTVADHPLSTFSIDVDTASYANVRRFLNMGQWPPLDAVRIEELVNYFRYEYPEPRGDAPVSITTELAAAPWNARHRLALVGLRSIALKQERTPPRNLTFLLDVSGSMAPPARLPLIKTAMQMLVDTLRPEDKVAIVVYAGSSGIALPSTGGRNRSEIKHAIDKLWANGSTNGASGIQLAYDVATENFVKGGINRVILATDGDFNVGITSHADLLRLIEDKRGRGIFLSVLGVGDDNLKDSTMEMLADKGNGNYSYLDSIQEARRVLVAEAGATLVTVAKDVKVQIEFNPRFVRAYRLVGYENRVLRKQDFNNDAKDAGEMGAGHTVTALYELVPAGEPVPGGSVDPLRYQPQPPEQPIATTNSSELMNVKVRYKQPDGEASRLVEFPVANGMRSSSNLGFAAAVAEFGMLLRRSAFKGSASWLQAVALAREHRGRDEDGYRAEFVRLVELAAALDRRYTSPEPDPRR